MGLCSQPKVPDPNPGMLAAAQASERIAMEQLALAREQYDWARQQAGEDRAFLQPFLDQQMRIADSNEARAQDYYEYEKGVYRPLEMGIVEDAKAFDTEGERERLAREAVADIGQQFGQARATTARDLSRYGVNPSSTAFAETFTRMNTQEGLARAQAANNARTQAKALGHAMKMDAAGLGRGLASNASTAYGIALNANSGAQQGRMGLTQSEAGLRGQAMSGFGDAQRGFANAGGLYGSEFGARMQNWQGRQSQSDGMMNLIGTLGGSAMGMFKFKDGGPVPKAKGVVHGPGTGISDSITARLSDGEYVVPADVVRAKGVEFFDKLKAKYHTPAAAQRAMGVR